MTYFHLPLMFNLKQVVCFLLDWVCFFIFIWGQWYIFYNIVEGLNETLRVRSLAHCLAHGRNLENVSSRHSFMSCCPVGYTENSFGLAELTLCGFWSPVEYLIASCFFHKRVYLPLTLTLTLTSTLTLTLTLNLTLTLTLTFTLTLGWGFGILLAEPT